MQEDKFTELALDALVCRDEQQKEKLWQEALALEEDRLTKQKQDKPEKKVHYEFPPNFAGMVDGDNEAPYLVNKAPSDQYHTKNPEGGT